jgi:hypothetical protein
MAVRCKEMTERLKIIEDQEIEAIEAIGGGLGFELAACNLELLNKVGRPGVLVKVDQGRLIAAPIAVQAGKPAEAERCVAPVQDRMSCSECRSHRN